MGLYLAPEANGKGFAGTMAREMIAEATRQGVSEISLESTLTAQSFYQKMGFAVSGPQATLEIGGSKVRYIPMKMVL